MRHRADRSVDGPTQATMTTMRPKQHRATVPYRVVQQQLREEVAYNAWCQKHGMDPLDTASMVAYEGSVGFLYLDEPPEDHR